MAMLRRTLAASIGGAVLLFAEPASAQIPDTFTNLTRLPADIDRGELMRTMKGFSMALGVRCVHCHVGDDARGFDSFDFASDDKPAKQTARIMLQMTAEINERLDTALSERSDVSVRCVTCHRGQARPMLIEDLLISIQAERGLSAATAEYDRLRSEYFGSHTYDFSEDMLLGLAERRLVAGDVEGALRWTELNIEHHSESAGSYFQLGMIQARSGQRDAAILSLERALELNPDIPPARKMLDRLKGD